MQTISLPPHTNTYKRNIFSFFFVCFRARARRHIKPKGSILKKEVRNEKVSAYKRDLLN